MEHCKNTEYIDELYRTLPLSVLRETKNVEFDSVPRICHLDGIDLVSHEPGAISPGAIGKVSHPWYFHPHQSDNLLILEGTRIVELYNFSHGKIEVFEISKHWIKKNNKIIFDGHAILGWPPNTFHRNKSGEKGSLCMNFSQRSKGFDLDHEFNIYSVDLEKKTSKIVRQGFKDQKNHGKFTKN